MSTEQETTEKKKRKKEQKNQKKLKKLIKKQNKAIKKELDKEELDTLYWHEAADRTDMVRNIIHEVLESHPVIAKHPSFVEKLEQVQKILGNLYKDINDTQE